MKGVFKKNLLTRGGHPPVAGLLDPGRKVPAGAFGLTGPLYVAGRAGVSGQGGADVMDPSHEAEPSFEKKFLYKKGIRILVHMCCGPCSIYPIKELLRDTAEVWGFFYNPNIHPYSEFQKRLGAVKLLAGLISVNVICDESYRPRAFIRNLRASIEPGHIDSRIPPVGERCTYCYFSRLEETAKAALEQGFTAFSSSLLYSKYQNHEEIRRLGIEIGRRHGIPFYYDDFRVGWRAGIDSSREMGLYRQKYCGCIYSRIERFSDKGKKAEKL